MASYERWPPNDRAEAVSILARGFITLHQAVMRAAGWTSDPYREPSGPIWNWWQAVGIPVIHEWQQFNAEQGSAWRRFMTGWGVYDKWHEQLDQLRRAVEASGIAV